MTTTLHKSRSMKKSTFKSKGEKMKTKIKIREEIDHLINIDASIGGYQFDLILVCSSETYCGRNWHLVIPNWQVNCRIGKDLIYNKIKIEEALQPVMQYTDEYVEVIAKIVTEHLEKHDEVIDKAVIENLVKADKKRETT